MSACGTFVQQGLQQGRGFEVRPDGDMGAMSDGAVLSAGAGW